MENFALQRGPTAVLSTERFSSKLGRRTYPAAAVILDIPRRPAQALVVRTNVAFDRIAFAGSLDVGIKSQFAGLFEGLEAFDTDR